MSVISSLRLFDVNMVQEWLLEQRKVLGPIFAVKLIPFTNPVFVLIGETCIHELAALESRFDLRVVLPPAYEKVHGMEVHLMHSEAQVLEEDSQLCDQPPGA
jgi:hypothetical protein